MIEAARWNVDICDADALVVSGHAKPVGDRYEPKVYMEMLVAIRASISASKSKGMSLGEVQAQRPTSAFDAVWEGLRSRRTFSRNLSTKACNCG
ncbi:hypothetical protein [Agrobacterium pusense]|jgi:hypothetical protein|uniref:hypothetical protein n=1 Tax=Agrobacterium pusense TaxID=648995 RepID=UPI00289C0BBF|nr:hypothetical protein [Agrobacterium pusense]